MTSNGTDSKDGITVYPTINMRTTGDRIRRMRIAAGLSVRELSKMLCLSDVQAVYKWQRGESLPSLDNLVLLSMIFHVPIDDIMSLSYTEHQ